MNFSVTGEPAPSQLDQKRKQLAQSLLRGGPGQSRLLAQGNAGGKGGFTRGFTANDSPFAAVPGLTFNPFVAQLQRGGQGQGLAQPTQGIRQQINDLTGGQQPVTPFGVSGVAPPQAGGPPIADNGPTGGVQPGADPAAAAAQPAPGASPDLAYLMSGQGGSGEIFRNLFGYDPTAPPPPPVTTPLQYLRPTAGQRYAV